MTLIQPTRAEALSTVLAICRHATHVEYYLSKIGLDLGEFSSVRGDSGRCTPLSYRQRPHDIVGRANKFTWPVLEGLALEPRDKAMKCGFVRYLVSIYPQEYAHLSSSSIPEIDDFFVKLPEDAFPAGSWEEEQLQQIGVTYQRILTARDLHRQQYHHRMWNGLERNPSACDADMAYGAIDAICSLLEDRPYQGGRHTFADVPDLPGVINLHSSKKVWMGRMLEEMQKLPQPDLNLISLVGDKINRFDLLPETHQQIVERTKRAVGLVEKFYK